MCSSVDDALRPVRGERGAARELLERQIARHGEVVVAGEEDRAALAGERDARVGIGPVAHEIAQAPDRVDALLGGRGEHGLEGVAVSVDVREKGGAHLQQWCECTVDG